MEYLITMAVFLLVVTYFLVRWSEKLIEKLKEILPPVKAEEKENSFLPPKDKGLLRTPKGHPLGEGVYGYVEAYVTDNGTAYALTVFNGKGYRWPAKDLFREFPKERRKNPPERPFHRIDLREITTTTGANGYVCL